MNQLMYILSSEAIRSDVTVLYYKQIMKYGIFNANYTIVEQIVYKTT